MLIAGSPTPLRNILIRVRLAVSCVSRADLLPSVSDTQNPTPSVGGVATVPSTGSIKVKLFSLS
jgi:hypothetical protein